MTPPSLPRRRLLGAGIGGLGLLGAAGLTGCGKNVAAPVASSASTPASRSAYPAPLRAVALSAAVENLVLTGYDIAVVGSARGTYGEVPPVVASALAVAHGQHAQHADAWNGLLTGAGLPALLGTPLAGADGLLAAVRSATTATALVQGLLTLERTAAATALALAGADQAGGAAGAQLAATVAPVEAQHEAVLLLLVGGTPVPRAQLDTGAAVRLDRLTV